MLTGLHVQMCTAEKFANCKCLGLLFNSFDIQEIKGVTEERSTGRTEPLPRFYFNSLLGERAWEPGGIQTLVPTSDQQQQSEKKMIITVSRRLRARATLQDIATSPVLEKQVGEGSGGDRLTSVTAR